MLVTRVISGIVGGGAAVFIIYEGSWLFFALLSFLMLGGWIEYTKLVRAAGEKMPCGTIAVWLFAVLFALAFNSVKGLTLLAVLLSFFLFLRTVFKYGRIRPVNSAYALYGTVYVGAGFIAMFALRSGLIGSYFRDDFAAVMLDPGRFFMFLVLFSVWASDTFAYFAGRAFGKNKLCPAISPGKTLEGALGGFIGAVAVALIVSLVFRFSVLHGVIIGLIVAITAPLGDLIESVLKRTCGVKDSGALIPGHGGILDRFDSLLIAAPAVYAYLVLAA